MESLTTQVTMASSAGTVIDDDFDPRDLIQSGAHNLKEVKPFAVMREHENSVDCISANPANQNEFATGSHDKTIKIWDVTKQQSIKTLTGHKEGVWCINYNKNGTQLVTASPEGIAKLWDPKTGKSTHDLKGHTKRVCKFVVFWATYNPSSTMIATCGSDRMVLLWDLKNLSAPIASNTENESVVLSVDFFQDDKYLVTTNLEGDVNIISQQDNMSVIKHETIEGHQRTNAAFCCTTIKNHPAEAGVFLVGAENKHITKFRFDARDYEIQKIGQFVGHSNSVRNVQVSNSLQRMLSCCEDHSLRVWDYQTCEAKMILSGHRDNVSGGAFLNENTIVSSSWDLRVMMWKI